MTPTMTNKSALNTHQWRHCTMIYLSILFWITLLLYMLLFHFLRAQFQPVVMNYFGARGEGEQTFIEMHLFLSLLWSSCIVSLLAVLSGWGKLRRANDKRLNTVLMWLILSSIAFALYYADQDLAYIDEYCTMVQALLANYLPPLDRLHHKAA